MTSVEVFYDGACPLCSREAAWLRRLDKRARIRLTDIAAPGFDPAPLGVQQEDLMARIHARLPDGRLIEGVEVFRRVYEAIGFGPLVSVSRLPGVSALLDGAYGVFARNRLRLGGWLAPAGCEDGRCEIPKGS